MHNSSSVPPKAELLLRGNGDGGRIYQSVFNAGDHNSCYRRRIVESEWPHTILFLLCAPKKLISAYLVVLECQCEGLKAAAHTLTRVPLIGQSGYCGGRLGGGEALIHT